MRAAAIVACLAGLFAACHSSRGRTPTQAAPPVTSPASTASTVEPSTSTSVAPSVRDAKISFVSPEVGWAVVWCGSGCNWALESTADGGVSWKVVPTGIDATITGVAFADRADSYVWASPIVPAGEAAAPGTPTLFVTHDGARTWQPTTVNEPVVQLFTGTSEDWALVGACPGIDTSCRSRLLVSGDRGQTWTERAQPVVGVTPRLERVGSSAWLTEAEISTKSDGQLWFSADDGRQSSPRPLPPACDTFGAPIVQAVSSQDLWLVCPGQPSAGLQAKSVSRSADGGQHWRTVAASRGGTSPAIGDIGGIDYVAQVVALSDSRAWMTSDRGSVSVSDDGGATWQSGPDLPPAESFFDDAQFIDAAHGWIAVLAPPYDALALLRTNDGGRSWQGSSFVVP